MIQVVEKARLQVGRHAAWNASVRPAIDAVEQGGMPLAEKLECLVAAAGEPLLFPNLIEPAWVAGVAGDQVLAPDPEPPRDPDVDGVSLAEPPWCRGGGSKRCWHNATLTGIQHSSLCADKRSKVMAAPNPMILYPAIDLKDGRCVRLERGEMAQATVFNDDPAAQAQIFAAQGFAWLHIVDLNGAFAGRPVNGPAVEAILGAVSIPVQLGGGIRDLATIEMWLGRGVRRVILGTAAVKDPALVREACRKFPGRIVVGIDARGGKVAVEGWAQTSDLDAVELARRFEDAGVAAIVYTDIDRDGVLQGLNLPATAELARATSIPVIASGGLAGIDDVRALLRPEYAKLQGVIAGRALYDGRLDAREALALVHGTRR